MIPFNYKVYWLSLMLLISLLVIYFLVIYKKDKAVLIKYLSMSLLFLALIIYVIEQGRVFTGYFDPVKGVFVAGYHEPNNIGFLRFLYKLISGIALAMYGFIIFFNRQREKNIINDLKNKS